MPKLSNPQIYALQKLAAALPVGGASAHTLHVRLDTLRALQRRGFVTTFSAPWTSIIWTITPSGRAALKEATPFPTPS